MSGWLNLPATGATKMREWQFGWQFYEAIQLRYQAATRSCSFFPPASPIGDSGTIAGVTHTGTNLVFSMTGVDWPAGRWVDWVVTDACYVPAFYDLIIVPDLQDPWTVVRGTISAMTYSSGSGTLTIPDTIPLNAVAANFIPSIASLAGAKWYIIKQGGLWYTDRRWTKPNDPELEKGTPSMGWLDSSGNGVIQQITSNYSPSPWDNDYSPDPPWPADTPQPPPIAWTVNKYVDKDLLAYTSDGYLHRQTVAGNQTNSVFCGNSVYKLTVSGTGTFTLGVNGTGTASIATSGGVSAIQTALAAIVSGATATGAGPFVVTFPSSAKGVLLTTATASGPTITIGKPDSATSIGSNFSIINSGWKADPARKWDGSSYWYNGSYQGVLSHDPSDGLSDANSVEQVVYWLNRDSDDNCVDFAHNAWQIDAQIELDNDCECGNAGDFAAPNFWKSWGNLQWYVANVLCTFFVDESNPFGPGLAHNGFTPASFLAYTGVGPTRKYEKRISDLYPNVGLIPDIQTDGLGNPEAIDPPTITPGGKLVTPTGLAASASPTGGTITHGTTRGYRISAVDASGETLACTEVTALCQISDSSNSSAAATALAASSDGQIYEVDLTSGGSGYTAVPTISFGGGGTGATAVATVSSGVVTGIAITAGGSGYSSPTVTFSGGVDSNTYSVNLTWNTDPGASGYNIYAPVAGSEKLLTSVGQVTTWLDDGTLSPSTTAVPTSNTTSNSCTGVGSYIYRDRSRGYRQTDPYGRSSDATGGFTNGDLLRVMGRSFDDLFDGQGANNSSGTPDVLAPYWDRNFFSGKWHKHWWRDRQTAKLPNILFATKQYLLTDRNFWSLGPNNGTARIQGGTSTGQSSTAVIDSGFSSGQQSCWAQNTRFIGTVDGASATPWYNFTLQIYDTGLPAGWTVTADGTASYSAPSPPGHSGTAGTTPTISAAGPSTIHATGLPQTVWFDGNHFDPACTGVLTNTDTGDTFPLTFSSVAYGELALSFNFGFIAANWSLVITNPGPNASSAFTFTTKAVWRARINSFSGGDTFNFTAPDGFSGSGTVGYLIPEPYKLGTFWGRQIEFEDGTLLPIRATDNNVIFFDAQSSAPTGTTATIIEYDPATTVKFTTSTPSSTARNVQIASGQYFIEPTGTNSVGGKFDTKYLNANDATIVTTTGMMHNHDIFGPWIPNELQTMILALKETFGNPSCSPYASLVALADNAPDLNSGGTGIALGFESEWCPFGCAYTNYNDTWNHWISYFDGTVWPNSASPITQYGCPFAAINTGANAYGPPNNTGTIIEIDAASQYAYVWESNLPICLDCSVTWWMYAWLDGSDDTPGVVSDWPSRVENTFDAAGTPLAWHTWVDVGGASASGVTTVVGPMVGTAMTSPPDIGQPSDPGPHDPGGGAGISVNSGYYIPGGGLVSICTWDFAPYN